MNKLITLEKIHVPNVKALRSLYDNIESNVRALNSVGIEQEHFGPLLITLALEKLPDTNRLQVSRKLGNSKWNITDFLRSIHEEIIARENYEFLKEEEKWNNRGTVSSLIVTQRYKMCVLWQQRSL